MQATVVGGVAPVVVGMQGSSDVGVPGVVGVHGTVVELPGAVVVVPVGHGGSVVELVGAGVHGNVVGVPTMDVDVPVGQGGSGGAVVPVPGTVVGVPGVVVMVVVVATAVVVVVPGVGPVPQPNDCNRDLRIAVAAGKPENAVWSDMTSWQMGWRMAGSSWARVDGPATVCETATAC